MEQIIIKVDTVQQMSKHEALRNKAYSYHISGEVKFFFGGENFKSEDIKVLLPVKFQNFEVCIYYVSRFFNQYQIYYTLIA